MDDHECIAADIRHFIRCSGHSRNIEPTEFVFHEGQAGDSLYLIDKGRVVVQRRTPLGDVATLTVLGRDDMFGEMALLGDRHRTATVRTLEPCRFHILDRAKFDELRRLQPTAGLAFEQMLAEMVRRLSDRLVEALFEDARVRLARRLVELASMYSADESGGFIPLTQEMIGSMAGVKLRQTAKRLQEFDEQKLIRLERSRIFITNLARLRQKGRLIDR